ncbi:MAG: beta-lactamase family protein, partial [Acidobacteria bacterium]|nr:beta-lactamase family protein [Acidobacteriota bacterium]
DYPFFYSTVDDLGRYLLFHLNSGAFGGKRLVSQKALARMYRPHPPVSRDDMAYGLGLNVGSNPKIRHLGASGTLLWLDFEHDSAGVLLTQVPWGNHKELIPRLTGKIASFYPR